MQKGSALIIPVILIPAIIIFGIWAYQYNFLNVRQIHNFEDCDRAGYRDPRADPIVCITPDGQRFSWEDFIKPSPSITPTPLAYSEEDKIIDLIKNGWNVYKNPGLYDFAYPKNWQAGGKECGGPSVSPPDNSFKDKYANSFISFCSYSSSLSLEERLENLGENKKLISQETTTVGGLSAIKTLVKARQQVGSNEFLEGYETNFYILDPISKEDFVQVTINNYEGSSKSKYDETYTQIIESIKFYNR